jgi:hypothetical protein
MLQLKGRLGDDGGKGRYRKQKGGAMPYFGEINPCHV